MDKQEARNEIMQMNTVETAGRDAFTMAIPVEGVIGVIDRMDEPEKPVVPSFIADYIEYAKPRHDSLYQAMEERASEEKKYHLLLPKITRNWKYFSLRPNYDGLIDHYTDNKGKLYQFTEQEIKDYDERFWPFAEEVSE